MHKIAGRSLVKMPDKNRLTKTAGRGIIENTTRQGALRPPARRRKLSMSNFFISRKMEKLPESNFPLDGGKCLSQ